MAWTSVSSPLSGSDLGAGYMPWFRTLCGGGARALRGGDITHKCIVNNISLQKLQKRQYLK